MSVVKPYDDAYYSMTWMGPKGYPEQGNSGRCYFTGLLGMFRLHGESDVLSVRGQRALLNSEWLVENVDRPGRRRRW